MSFSFQTLLMPQPRKSQRRSSPGWKRDGQRTFSAMGVCDPVTGRPVSWEVQDGPLLVINGVITPINGLRIR